MLLAQINLVWVSVVHRHEEGPLPARAATLQGGNGPSQPVLATGLLCTACQILRQSAARLTLSTPAPIPAASSPVGFTVDPGESLLRAPRVAYGRAPPLY